MKNQTNDNHVLTLLVELRARLIYSLLVLCVLFVVLSYYANHLYSFLARPLLHYLPQGHLIATHLITPFTVPFKLAFLCAMLLVAPYFLYHAWSFVAPALYRQERKRLWPFILLSAVLFYAGVAFAYFALFPMLFGFLSKMVPVGVVLSPDMSDYFDLTMTLLVTFGVLFEIPVVMIIVVLMGVVDRETLKQRRSYAFLFAFIIGMLLAPPDVLSMTMLAIPIWLLYELGLLLTCTLKNTVEKK